MQKSIRLLKIWKLCYEKRRSINELAEMCMVTERTIYRDLQALSELEVMIAYDRGYYVAQETPLPQLALTRIEQLVLTLALQNMPLHLDTELEDVVNGLLNKLLDRPVGNSGISLVSGPKSIHKGQVFTRLQKAVDNNCYVTLVEYQRLGGEIILNLTVEPYHLVFREQNWYLVAWSPRHENFRIFRMSRIVRLKEENTTFKPRMFDPKAYFKGSLGIVVDKQQRIIARFTGMAKEIVKKDGRFTEKDFQDNGDSLILDTVINGEIQWLRWLLGFGGEVEILQPPGMREKAARMLNEGLQHYQ